MRETKMQIGKNFIITISLALFLILSPRSESFADAILADGGTEVLAIISEAGLLGDSDLLILLNQNQDFSFNNLKMFNRLVLKENTFDKLMQKKLNPSAKNPNLRESRESIWKEIEELDIRVYYIFDKEQSKFYISRNNGGFYSLNIKLENGSGKLNFNKAKLAIVSVDGNPILLNEFDCKSQSSGGGDCVLTKKIKLTAGIHVCKILLKTQGVLLSPIPSLPNKVFRASIPDIKFQKINPSRYIVEVNNAKMPFWLVFGNTYNYQWKLFKSRFGIQSSGNPRLYPSAKVTEFNAMEKISLKDIGYLLRQSIPAVHYQVNGYANAWFVDPELLKLGNKFTLDAYYLPQSIFYLFWLIFIVLILICLVYIVWKKANNEK